MSHGLEEAQALGHAISHSFGMMNSELTYGNEHGTWTSHAICMLTSAK